MFDQGAAVGECRSLIGNVPEDNRLAKRANQVKTMLVFREHAVQSRMFFHFATILTPAAFSAEP